MPEEESIFDIVRICPGPVSSDYCKRMLRIAVFLNEMIDSLNTKKGSLGRDKFSRRNKIQAMTLVIECRFQPRGYCTIALPVDKLGYGSTRNR
jgi:hypothetical protein